MTTYFYIRVSTDLQNCANQRFELETFAHKNNIKVDEIIEETISYRKPLDKRKLGKLLRKLAKGDKIITTEISRLGRNMFEVMGEVLSGRYRQDNQAKEKPPRGELLGMLN